MSRTLCAIFSIQSVVGQFDNNDDCDEKNSLYENEDTGSSSIQSSQALLGDLPPQKIVKRLDRLLTGVDLQDLLITRLNIIWRKYWIKCRK